MLKLYVLKVQFLKKILDTEGIIEAQTFVKCFKCCKAVKSSSFFTNHINIPLLGFAFEMSCIRAKTKWIA